MKPLQHHSMPSAMSSSTTLDMVLDALDDIGVTVMRKPEKTHRGLRRIQVITAARPEPCCLPPHAPDGPSVLTLMLFSNLEQQLLSCPTPTLICLAADATDALASEALNCSQTCDAALVRLDASTCFETAVSAVSNYLIQMSELEAQLTQILKTGGTFQDLVDAVEPHFGRYAAITDVNDALIARTQHVPPDDPVNESLVELGFHSNALTAEERDGAPIAKHITEQKDLVIYQPKPPFPYCLITHAIRVRDSFYAYLVMTCPERELSDGVVDAFGMLAHACDRLARRKAHNEPHTDHMLTGFLTKLFTDKELDAVFLHDQAERLHIPAHGMFTLASISIEHPLREQLEHVAHRIKHAISHTHWTLIENERIYILFHAATWSDAMEANVQLSELQLDGAFEMRSSDVYENLSDTCYAFRELAAIEGYLPFVRHCRTLTGSQKHDNVIAFHDVFCFFWDDPFAEADLRGFAMDHTRLSKMEFDDERDQTNNVALLNAYLIMERKATQVGELFHMHRNGVIYRMDKIQRTYHLDLDDYLTRQYLQICARIKLIATKRFTIEGPAFPTDGAANAKG